MLYFYCLDSTAATQFSTKLPNYVEATTLPSYEEAERSKMEDTSQNENFGDPERVC